MGPITEVASAANIVIDFDEAAFRSRLLSWYDATKRSLPWRLLWERHADPYHVWLSEIMLQQTVIKAVIPAYHRFLETFPTVFDLAAANETDVRLASRGLGYYRRFGLLHRAAQEIVARYARGPIGADGRRAIVWPETYSAWRELAGIGDYTAAAVSSIAFGYPRAVVDGNVERVFCRLFDIRLAPNLAPLKRRFQRLAGELLDQARPGDFNQAMMELGQTVCTKVNPDCGGCPVREFCRANARGSWREAPQTKAAMVYKDVAMRLVIARRSGHIGLVERPRDARFLGGTWGFATELAEATGGFRRDGSGDPPQFANERRMGRAKHSITSHRISAEVFLAESADMRVRWLPVDQVEENLVSNLDRKAWHLALRHREDWDEV